jgi:FKBP-type peptidyl-prolyl cis-trans isomerase 2
MGHSRALSGRTEEEYMRIALVLLAAFMALPALGQEPVVSRDTIWQDTVKRGEMLRQVRGLGEIANRQSVTLRIAETQVKEVQTGQEVAIDTRQKTALQGKVTRVGSSASDGVVMVDVGLNAPLPQGLEPGLAVDGTILIGRLPQVTYVGRPVFGAANTEVTLFKIEPDDAHATRVKVRFGRSSVNTIEVVEGLQPGDHVILSDMRAYADQSRIRLQ